MANLVRFGALNTTQFKKPGGVTAVVLPFRVAEATPMQRPSVYTYSNTAPPGVNVHRLRTERGWSQRQLADACRPALDHTTIRRLEHNEGFTQDTLERVAKALHVEVWEIFLPEGLGEWSALPDDAKKRITAAIQDAAAAARYRRSS
jgi:transcriptional regulator with XRE-family HTH domain